MMKKIIEIEHNGLIFINNENARLIYSNAKYHYIKLI